MVINKLDKDVLTTREVARLLHLHVNTVRRWSNCGILKVFRIGLRGDRRFKYEDVISLLELNYPSNYSAARVEDRGDGYD